MEERLGDAGEKMKCRSTEEEIRKGEEEGECARGYLESEGEIERERGDECWRRERIPG